MSSKTPRAVARRNELYESFSDGAIQLLVKLYGMTQADAAEIGEHLTELLIDNWRGQVIYIPKDQRRKLAERDWEIYKRFERGNASELAAEFDLSEVRIYQICNRCAREVQQQKTQRSTLHTRVTSMHDPSRSD